MQESCTFIDTLSQSTMISFDLNCKIRLSGKVTITGEAKLRKFPTPKGFDD